jgi:hypothetical protein
MAMSRLVDVVINRREEEEEGPTVVDDDGENGLTKSARESTSKTNTDWNRSNIIICFVCEESDLPV